MVLLYEEGSFGGRSKGREVLPPSVLTNCGIRWFVARTTLVHGAGGYLPPRFPSPTPALCSLPPLRFPPRRARLPPLVANVLVVRFACVGDVVLRHVGFSAGVVDTPALWFAISWESGWVHTVKAMLRQHHEGFRINESRRFTYLEDPWKTPLKSQPALPMAGSKSRLGENHAGMMRGGGTKPEPMGLPDASF